MRILVADDRSRIIGAVLALSPRQAGSLDGAR